MTANASKGGTGLRGRDKQQDDLRDARTETREAGSHPSEADLPEGLRRQRQGPYDKDRGRDTSGAPIHPKPKE